MVQSLLSNVYSGHGCLRTPPSTGFVIATHLWSAGLGPGFPICVRRMGGWFFEVSEVKEDSLKVARDRVFASCTAGYYFSFSEYSPPRSW
jgi:hypothetical protein